MKFGTIVTVVTALITAGAGVVIIRYVADHTLWSNPYSCLCSTLPWEIIPLLAVLGVWLLLSAKGGETDAKEETGKSI